MLSPQAHAGAYWARKKNRAAVLTDDLSAPAWGTIVFSANPSAGHTVTINGTVITFNTTVAIGATLALTLAATVAYIVANPITGATVKVSGDALLVESSAPSDTSVTIAASNATVSNATLQKRRTLQRVPR